MLRKLKGLLWRAVFWWKRRTGWIVLAPRVSVVGTVTATESNSDGDVTFDIEVDGEYDWLVTGMGDVNMLDMHCETVPWLAESIQDQARGLSEGDRVCVTGQWGFDGVHTSPDYDRTWYRFAWEIFLALWRHQPNMKYGWFEIHPVEKIEKL